MFVAHLPLGGEFLDLVNANLFGRLIFHFHRQMPIFRLSRPAENVERDVTAAADKEIEASQIILTIGIPKFRNPFSKLAISQLRMNPADDHVFCFNVKFKQGLSRNQHCAWGRGPPIAITFIKHLFD
jgi:hypothetical protein